MKACFIFSFVTVISGAAALPFHEITEDPWPLPTLEPGNNESLPCIYFDETFTCYEGPVLIHNGVIICGDGHRVSWWREDVQMFCTCLHVCLTYIIQNNLLPFPIIIFQRTIPKCPNGQFQRRSQEEGEITGAISVKTTCGTDEEQVGSCAQKCKDNESQHSINSYYAFCKNIQCDSIGEPCYVKHT